MSESQDEPQPSTSVAAEAKAPDDKIDLFRVPHTRMKELVDWPLSEMAMAIDIRELEPNLQAVYEAMWELKSHEYIENTYIMKMLKDRLHKRRVYNELVCNCHEDSRLLDVIHLVEKVYLATTQKSRFQYSRQLQCAILKFLQEFEKHMKEEESVFGPLLTENFKKEELKAMNETVLKQHNLLREVVRSEKSLHKAVKRKLTEDIFNGDDLGFDLDGLRFKKSYCQEVKERLSGSQDNLNPGEEPVSDDEPDDINPFAKSDAPETNDDVVSEGLPIPDEMLLTIFVNLNVRDLVSASAVCKRWRKVAFSSVLWKALYPAQWARGIWLFDRTLPLESDIPKVNRIEWSDDDDDDAGDSDDESAAKKPRKHEAVNESKIFQGVIRDLLPKIGSFVSTLILSASQKITNTQVRGMLIQLLNVRNVDLSYTKVSGEALIGLPKAGALLQLEELDLSGCREVSNNFLENLSFCYTLHGHKSHLRKISLSGCHEITEVGVLWLAVHKPALVELDLSGCMKLSGKSLKQITDNCPRLDPELLFYCSQIEDGPYSDTFSGCANLECAIRVCCRKF